MAVTKTDKHAEALHSRLASYEAELAAAHEQLAAERQARKRLETVLRETDQVLSGFIERSPAAVIGIDLNNDVTLWNAAAEELFGWSAAEVLGRPYPLLLDAPEEVLEQARIVSRGEGARLLVTQRRRRDGVMLDVGITYVRLYSAKGELTGLVGLVTDLTKQHRTEAELHQAYRAIEQTTAELRRNRNLLLTLFNSLDDGLMLLDGAGNILMVNQALGTLFGFRAEDVIDKHWSAITQYDSFDGPGMAIVQTLYDGRTRRRREACTHRDGRRNVLDIQTLVLRGIIGAIDNVIVHVTDITEQLHFETLDLQNERFAASAQLITTIAHELNTPLLSIQSCLFLAEQATGADRESYLSLAREEIDRIGAVLRQLLDLHRPDVGESSDVLVNPLIERVLMLTGGALAEHHISVERDLSDECLQVRGYPGQLTQVLLNLIMNAVEAMQQGGKLTLRTRHVEQSATWPAETESALKGHHTTIHITVADTGVGIDPMYHDEIFRSFFTTRAMGTGLGLPISRQIVQRHGGTITFQSQPGVGSEFTIILPISTQQQPTGSDRERII
jgi:PAS domain S-box-containing protein